MEWLRPKPKHTAWADGMNGTIRLDAASLTSTNVLHTYEPPQRMYRERIRDSRAEYLRELVRSGQMSADEYYYRMQMERE